MEEKDARGTAGLSANVRVGRAYLSISSSPWGVKSGPTQCSWRSDSWAALGDKLEGVRQGEEGVNHRTEVGSPLVPPLHSPQNRVLHSCFFHWASHSVRPSPHPEWQHGTPKYIHMAKC